MYLVNLKTKYFPLTQSLVQEQGGEYLKFSWNYPFNIRFTRMMWERRHGPIGTGMKEDKPTTEASE